MLPRLSAPSLVYPAFNYPSKGSEYWWDNNEVLKQKYCLTFKVSQKACYCNFTKLPCSGTVPLEWDSSDDHWPLPYYVLKSVNSSAFIGSANGEGQLPPIEFLPMIKMWQKSLLFLQFQFLLAFFVINNNIDNQEARPPSIQFLPTNLNV